MSVTKCLVSFSLFALACLVKASGAAPALHSDEVEALKEIASTVGAKFLNLTQDPCQSKTLVITKEPLKQEQESTIECDCHFDDNSTCHITQFILKSFSLPGKLPREFVKLRHLELIDLCRNSLSGSIPTELASLPNLKSLGLCANRLSGELPKGLGRFTNLTWLNLEANQFSGTIPDELGNLANLEGMGLVSNRLVGSLPKTFSRLTKLKDFRISDNRLNGSIPEFIGNWRELTRLELYSSGLRGPIPDSISLLEKLSDLRISDMEGANKFPVLSSKSSLKHLVLRNMNLSGPIPSYIWRMKTLTALDLSFNRLTGEVPPDAGPPEYVYLSGNMLSGKIEAGSFLTAGTNIDLSYNNFTWSPKCKERIRVNTYRSSYVKNNLTGLLPCAGIYSCQKYQRSLHINCGGGDVTITNTRGIILYHGDNFTESTAARNFHWTDWGFSSTGDFVDDNISEDTYSVTSNSTLAADHPELYKSARRSPLSLTYYAFCLENGGYTVKLHFAELQFLDGEPYLSLGRRVFDVYVQEELILKDFNIKEAVNGTNKAIVKEVNTTVKDHTLEIRLFWAGKGTRIIPGRGTYGPLISAVSVCPSSANDCGEIPESTEPQNQIRFKLVIGLIIATLCIIFTVIGFCCWRTCARKYMRERDLRGIDLQKGVFTMRQLQAATDNFNPANKIGEGGFGAVYKGQLSDKTAIAVKKLSSTSRQGNREFVNEIVMFSILQHPNLVKLYGCCAEEKQLLLVYEYMENNCLGRALFGSSPLKLDWLTRRKICVGIARGLAFLHDESALKIVHRDIKATNVLLDEKLNAKIADFGLARLKEDKESHISTRVAGTIGYLAPEYAMRGHLTEKADVYSLGVVALEIVSGKNNTNFEPGNDRICLLDWAFELQKEGRLKEIVDSKLEGAFDAEEAERMVKVALVCTNASPTVRPTMLEVVSMLDGAMEIPEAASVSSAYSFDLRFMRKDCKWRSAGLCSEESGSGFRMQMVPSGSSASGYDLYPLNPESFVVESREDSLVSRRSS